MVNQTPRRAGRIAWTAQLRACKTRFVEEEGFRAIPLRRLNKEPRTSSLDTYSGNGVFFSYLSEHWIIEEFRDRNVLGQPLASASLDHEFAS